MSFYFLEKNPPPNITLSLNIMRYTSATSIGFMRHNHASIEILIQESGSLHTRIGETSYLLSAGDLLVINPYEIHSGEWKISDAEPSSYLCLTATLPKHLTFPNSILSQKLLDLMSGKSGFTNYISRNESLLQIMLQLSSSFSDKTPASECMTLSLLYSGLSILFDQYYHEKSTMTHVKYHRTFLENISEYISEHYQEPQLTSAHAAQSLFMDQSQFCRLVRHHFGCSFSNHLCQYRIIRASELYKDSSLSISEIAAAVGFSDYCYFSRSFKKYIGLSPARYFEKWK